MATLFISYAHRDMRETNWLERLTLYLSPLRSRRDLAIWDDRKLEAGRKFENQISTQLKASSSAILLVGPGFLASEFIQKRELPRLLRAAQRRGTRIFPLVIGYCGYSRSALGPYQAFNDPETPLESLPAAEQNKVLNGFSMAVENALLYQREDKSRGSDRNNELSSAMHSIADNLRKTFTAFRAQCRLRDALAREIRQRLRVKRALQYEKFFFRYFSELTRDEKFQFDQIRAITEGPLFEGNRKILQLLENNPLLLRQLPTLVDLKQHLTFWLNKFERVFRHTPEMCVLYTGVEDGVPFPEGMDANVSAWLARVKLPRLQKHVGAQGGRRISSEN